MTLFNHFKNQYVDLSAMARDWYAEGLVEPEIVQLLLDYAWHEELCVTIPELKQIALDGPHSECPFQPVKATPNLHMK